MNVTDNTARNAHGKAETAEATARLGVGVRRGTTSTGTIEAKQGGGVRSASTAPVTGHPARFRRLRR